MFEFKQSPTGSKSHVMENKSDNSRNNYCYNPPCLIMPTIIYLQDILTTCPHQLPENKAE